MGKAIILHLASFHVQIIDISIKNHAYIFIKVHIIPVLSSLNEDYWNKLVAILLPPNLFCIKLKVFQNDEYST